MVELAYNVNGERFDVPETAAYRRVRRFKQVMPLVELAVPRLGAPAATEPMRNARPVDSDDEPDLDESEDEEFPDEDPKRATAPLGLGTMAHILAIQEELTPTEVRITQGLFARLQPGELGAWMAQLSSLPVDEAVGLIRRCIASEPAATTSDAAL